MRLYGTFDPLRFLSFEQSSFDTTKKWESLICHLNEEEPFSFFFGGQKDPHIYSSFRFLYSFWYPILDPLNQCYQLHTICIPDFSNFIVKNLQITSYIHEIYIFEIPMKNCTKYV